MINTNQDKLVAMTLAGEIAPPSIPGGIYEITYDGRPLVIPSVGGICLNVRVGDPAFGWVGDHIEPAVSSRHPDEKTNIGYNVIACVGNPVTVTSGEAKGETGVVTGKHGGIEHVMVDFKPKVLEKLQLGDKLSIRAFGIGFALADAGDIKLFNMDPDFFEKWGATLEDGKLHVNVAKIVPAAIMGSGLGRNTVLRGDYDIQSFDPVTFEKYGLGELRFGDIVAIEDADHSFGRIYRTGAMSIGIVAHGNSLIAGHGPGVTSLATSTSGAIVPKVTKKANIATILDLR